MLRTMKRTVYWPGMQQDIMSLCATCKFCQKVKKPTQKRTGLMKQVSETQVNELVQIDLVGPLPTTTEGNKYLLTCRDVFSGFTQAIPIKNKTSKNVTLHLLNHWIYRFGPMKQLLSDLGTEFDNKLLQLICERLRIKKLRTTAYSPQTNGAIERLHRYLKERLALIAEEF